MIRLACVIGVVVGLAVSAVATYRPQTQPVAQGSPVVMSQYGNLPFLPPNIGGGSSGTLPDIPFFVRELPDGRKMKCHALSHSLPVLCVQGRWYMGDGTDTSVAK